MKNNFFQSQSIAIIGASANPKKLGYQLLKNLLAAGFTGKVFPINLKEKEILGLESFQSVLDIHRQLDLAVIIVPREIVPQVLRQCVLKEIPYVVIISAGFAEKDAKGEKLQQELIKITKNSPTKIIGPNCLGIVDTTNNLNLTFAAADVLKGPIGLILQSGAIGAAIFDWAKSEEIGISKFISLGNKIHLTEIEALEILAGDEKTKAIALYLEEITDPPLFMAKCRELSLQKPIIILKGGMSIKGAKAAASHTGALSSPEELNSALFRQANLIVAEDYEELLDFLALFSSKIADFSENSLAIVTNAGGPGILAVDAASNFKMKLPKLSDKEIISLEKEISDFASLENPFDLGGDADALSYQKIIKFIQNINSFSAILAIVTPQATTNLEQIAQILSSFRGGPKILMACFLGGQRVAKSLDILAKAHLPHYDDPAEAIELLSKIYQYSKKREHPLTTVNLPKTVHHIHLSEQELISRYALPFAKSYEVSNDAEVMGHIETLGYPVAYKAAKIRHRGKRGKVGLNIDDHSSLERAIRVIGFPGILQEMIDSSLEIIIGARRDTKFGVTLLFGQGGIFVEEQKDTSFAILPLTARDLDEMIEETKVWQTLKRIQVKEAIKEVILKVALLMVENDDIKEIELNPLKVLPQKIIAVDLHLERIK